MERGSEFVEERGAGARLKLFESILESTNDAVLVTEAGLLDEPGPRIVYANEAFFRMTGYEAGDVLGKSPRVLQGPETGRAELDKIREALEKGEPFETELLNYRKDGSRFWVEISLVPIRGERGEITNWAALQRDTTGRREKERRLREMLVRYGSDMVTILEPDGTPRYESEEIERVLGYRHKEVVGNDFFRFVHPEDTGRLAESYGQMMETPGLNPPVEFRIQHADGSWLYFESIVNNLIDDPDVNGIVINSRDITKRKQTEMRLQEAETRYRTLVEEAPAIIYIQQAYPGEGASYNVSYMSPRVEEILGYPVERFVENPNFWNEIMHPEDLERVVGENERTDETEEPFSVEYRMIACGGEVVWVRDDATLHRGSQDEPLYWQGVMSDITARKKAEEDFEKSEERFRSVVQNSSEIVKIVDLDGTLRYASPAFERILGYDPEESIGMNVFDYVHPDDLRKVREETEKTLGKPGETRNVVEYRFRHADGSWRRLEAAGVYLLDDPSIRGVLVTQRDVTEARRAEEELHESEERFRGAFEGASTGMALIGLDRRFLRVNQSLCEMLGYSEEELLTKCTTDLTHPDDQEASRRRTQRVLSRDGTEQSNLEKRYIRKDGRTVWTISDLSLVRNSHREPSYFVALFQDITERKLAEENLRESEERYRKLVENSPDAILVHQEGNIVFINDAGIKLVGASRSEEMVGKALMEFVHPDHRKAVGERTARTQTSGEKVDLMEMKFLRIDGRAVDGEASAMPTLHQGKPATQSMIRDITERKRAENALRESEELYRRQARELELLHQARTAVARELDLATVFRTIVEATAKVYGYSLVSAYLLRDGELVLQHQIGHEQAIERIALDEGVSGRVASTGQPVLIEDVSEDPDFLGAFEGVVSEICVPLFDGGEVVGTLNVERTDTKLTEHDLELVCALGEHVSMAVARARLHAQVRDAEARYRTLVENIPAVTYIQNLDHTGNPAYISPQLKNMLGYEPAEAISDLYHRVSTIHPEDRERVLAEDRRTDETGEPFGMEYRQIHRDGRTVWVQDEAVVIRDERGDAKYWLGVQLDITERKEAEDRLRDSREKYRSVVESVREVIFRTDSDGRYTFLNPAWTEVTGFSMEESLGKSYLEFVHPDDLERSTRDFEATGNRGEGYLKYESRFVTKSGGLKWIEVSFREYFNEEGDFVGASGILNDVTERKALEEELEYRAYHDSLTGLPNRMMFNDRVNHALDRSLRQRFMVAVLFLDLDNFKVVNDSLGHEMGDGLLAEAAERLRVCLRPEDTICRLGGDEFAILLEESNLAGATWVAQRIADALREPFRISAQQEIFVTTSVGIALGDAASGGSPHDISKELIRKADMAMYRAKSSGKARYAVFDSDMDEKAAARLSLENELRACADRSWLSRRTSVPSVTRPALPHESPHDDDHLREGHPEVHHPPSPLRAPEELFVGVVPRVGALYDPAPGRVQGRGYALPRNLRDETELQQAQPGGLRIVAAVQVDGRALQHHPQRPGGVEGGNQKRRVVAVGGRGHRPYGDASPIHDHRTLEAPLAAVHRAFARLLAPAGRFRDAAIHRQLRELQANGPIVGFERHLAQPLDHPKLDPLVATIPKRGRRAGPVGDLLVGAPEHQNLNELLEDDPVGDTGTVAAQRVARLPLREQGGELLEDGLDDVWWERGHGYPLSSGSVENSPDDGASRARLQRGGIAPLSAQALRRAAEMEEFQVYYQPMVSISTGEVVGFEALLRWEHPERGLLLPDSFISLAEETGLIVPIGRWVLQEACRQAREWGEARDPSGLRPPTLSVNLSGLQFHYPGLAREVSYVLDQSALEPDALMLEITESVAMEDAEPAMQSLWKLKSLGVKLAIDDFGTGYSSLSYLRSFPVDRLKIDRSFVEALGHSPGDNTIVAGMIGLSQGLGIEVVAEGVETDEQLRQLRRLGCDIVQGNKFWKPLPAEEAGILFTGQVSSG